MELRDHFYRWTHFIAGLNEMSAVIQESHYLEGLGSNLEVSSSASSEPLHWWQFLVDFFKGMKRRCNVSRFKTSKCIRQASGLNQGRPRREIRLLFRPIQTPIHPKYLSQAASLNHLLKEIFLFRLNESWNGEKNSIQMIVDASDGDASASVTSSNENKNNGNLMNHSRRLINNKVSWL